MNWNDYLWTRCIPLALLIVLLTILPLSKCDPSVHISSTYDIPVTSSTLNWLPIGHYEPSKHNLVIGGYQISKSTDDSYNEGPSKQREMYVCRATQDGVWVAGAQLKGEKSCTVTFLGNVQSKENYELLENIDNAARLSWVSWDKFRQIPTGAVVITESMYVARHIGTENETDKDTSTPTYTHYIGTMERNENFGIISYVKSNGEQGSTNTGELLVETEPINYELTSVKLNSWRERIIKSEPRIIGQATIINSGNKRAKFAEAFGYKYKYLSYWGQGHAMIKALNTSIKLVNRTKLATIKWGMEEKYEREDSYSVEIDLEPGTGVNVTVRGNYTEYDVPYTGQLVSHYKDGDSKAREINGMRKEETMTDLRPEFGPIYFLSNFTIVPTTAAPTTTRGTPTTFISSFGRTTATSSTTNGHSDSNNIEENGDDDDNSIIPPKSDTNMQSDDGGPQSLKNKDALGGATNLLPCFFIFIVSFLLTLYRIT